MTEPAFIETREHLRFVEFCGACRRDRYIGLCYGLPGVGKTRSARQIAGWAGDPQAPGAAELDDEQLALAATGQTVFYTPEVVNSPGRVQLDLTQVVTRLRDVVREPSRRAFSHELAERNRLEAERLKRMKVEEDWLRDPDPDRTRQPEISPPRQRYSHWRAARHLLAEQR